MTAGRSHKDDISIGKDRWIESGWLESGDMASAQSRAVEIDDSLAMVMPFFEKLEMDCVAECCGIDAFCFWPESIELALGSLSEQERAELPQDISMLEDRLRQLSCEAVVSGRLNQYFLKATFLALLAHIRAVVERVNAGGDHQVPLGAHRHSPA
jgi:hypothetical protein